MKIVGIVLLSLAFGLPAFPAASKTPANPKAPKTGAKISPAKPDPVAQSYAALPATERIAIEADLIWTGDYNGIADGDIGAHAIAAVKAFQKRSGGKETGVLNPQERGQLAAAAKAKADAVGWRLVDDQVTGARLGVPAKLVPQSTQGRSGMKFSSAHGEIQIETFQIREPGTTLQANFDQQRNDPTRQVEYAVIKPDFFVLSGQQGGVKKFYQRAEIKNGAIRGFTILYDVATAGTVDRVVVAMSSAFVAFPSEAAGPAVHKKVEYATGIVVDNSGGILTDRRATEGCFVISVVGLGPVDRVADDEASDLALLRRYGTRNLRAVPIAASASAASDVTLAGIADPQVQGGGSAVSTPKARVGPAADSSRRPLEPAPAVGFSGAAALDDAGRLVGMVELTTPVLAGASAGGGAQAVLVPSETIRSFLDRSHIAVAGAPPTTVDFSAGIVRVICTRK